MDKRRPLLHDFGLTYRIENCEVRKADTNKLIAALNALDQEILKNPIDGEYQCECIKDNVIGGDCVWCHLTVAEKGLAHWKKKRADLTEGELGDIISRGRNNKWNTNGFVDAIISARDKKREVMR